MIGTTNAGGGGGTGKAPKITYTGSSLLTQEDKVNWNIRFLTSGTLTFDKLGNAANGIEVFLCGGGGGGITRASAAGGGGGGGGYVATHSTTPAAGTPYVIEIGAGGEAKADGGSTKFHEFTVEGGKRGSGEHMGGNGGSGGGGDGNGNGGTNGSDGTCPVGNGAQGRGAGVNTHEFGDDSLTIYAGGGGAYRGKAGDDSAGDGSTGGGVQAGDGKTNRGGGGGGGWNSSDAGKGGSGIVVIRNRRGA